jgi:hypothetical protein
VGKSIEVFEEGKERSTTLSLFPEDRCEGVLPDSSVVGMRLAELRLERPRQWGGLLAGAEPVAGAAARSLLGRTAPGQPQGHAL